MKTRYATSENFAAQILISFLLEFLFNTRGQRVVCYFASGDSLFCYGINLIRKSYVKSQRELFLNVLNNLIYSWAAYKLSRNFLVDNFAILYPSNHSLWRAHHQSTIPTDLRRKPKFPAQFLTTTTYCSFSNCIFEIPHPHSRNYSILAHK